MHAHFQDFNSTGAKKYIDTGVALYNATNHDKDYEIGFTITSYSSTGRDVYSSGGGGVLWKDLNLCFPSENWGYVADIVSPLDCKEIKSINPKGNQL